MTAIPSWDLGVGMRIDLECDDCGFVISHPGTGHADWRAMWTAARDHGWHGAAQAVGRHSCPDCVTSFQPAAA
ncbi:hypothetical protein ACNTMW_16360 [Planosporangium sp. 12N6]|uniref:hypothetical protein n=1 Tax=Planosporangium spinosum TaxID=3402278 RepID=UPI003CFB1A27